MHPLHSSDSTDLPLTGIEEPLSSEIVVDSLYLKDKKSKYYRKHTNEGRKSKLHSWPWLKIQLIQYHRGPMHMEGSLKAKRLNSNVTKIGKLNLDDSG